MEELLTTKEAAEMAGVTQTTIRSWVNRGKLEPFEKNVGRPNLYKARDVRWVLRNAKNRV